MNRDTVRQIVNISALVGTLIVNALSQILPFNGQTSAEIANRFTDNYFLPANYVFGIWSVIYIGLIAFTIYQALPSQRENPLFRRIGYWFAWTGVANGVWLLLFHYNQFALSTVAMAALLFALVKIYLAIRAGGALKAVETWTTSIPFSIYLGWITVATVANVTYVLIDAGWDGFGIAYETWGAIMIVVAAIIAGAFAYLNRDIAYAAVIIWAFVGIINRFPEVSVIALSAGITAALVGIAALLSTFVLNRGNGTSARAA